MLQPFAPLEGGFPLEREAAPGGVFDGEVVGGVAQAGLDQEPRRRHQRHHRRSDEALEDPRVAHFQVDQRQVSTRPSVETT